MSIIEKTYWGQGKKRKRIFYKKWRRHDTKDTLFFHDHFKINDFGKAANTNQFVSLGFSCPKCKEILTEEIIDMITLLENCDV